MADHRDRLAVLLGGGAQEREHLARGSRVEIAGRLVGEDDRRAGRQGAGDRHALLLTAGELTRTVRQPVAESEDGHQVIDPRAGLAVDTAAGEVEGQGDVLGRGQGRDQIEGLEDEADLLPAHPRAPVVIEGAQIGPSEDDLTGGCVVEAGRDIQQGRLARAGRPHDGGEGAAVDIEGDPVERADLTISSGHVAQAHDGLGVLDRVHTHNARNRCGAAHPARERTRLHPAMYAGAHHRSDQVVLVGIDDELHPIPQRELGENARDVRLDGCL